MAGTQFGIPPKQINNLQYTGSELALVPVTEASRAPTVNDKNYPIDCFWRNTTTRILYWLSGFDATGALWVNISSAGAGLLSTLSDTANTPVSPDPSSNIQLSGGTSNIKIVSDVPGFKLDFSISNQLSGTTTTAGAVTGNVITQSLGVPPGTYQVSCRVAAFCRTADGGPLSAGYELVGCLRTTAGAGSVIGTIDKVINEEGALSAGDATIIASGNNMIVQVTGTAGKTIQWKAELTYTFVS